MVALLHHREVICQAWPTRAASYSGPFVSSRFRLSQHRKANRSLQSILVAFTQVVRFGHIRPPPLGGVARPFRRAFFPAGHHSTDHFQQAFDMDL